MSEAFIHGRSPLAAIQVFEPQPGMTYNLETTAHLTGVSRRSILVYCKSGMVHPIAQSPYGALYFDNESIRAIQRIEYLRTICGINSTGVRMIFDLLQEVERLRQEMGFLRGF